MTVLRWSRYLTATLSACLLAAPTMAQQSATQHLTVALPAELDRVLRDYETEWRAGNAVGLAQLFSADGFVLSGDRPPVRGRAAIERSYAQADGSLHLRALAFATADSVGYIVGVYTNDPAGPDQGKFLLALVRKAGRWLIAADMDRSTRTPNP